MSQRKKLMKQLSKAIDKLDDLYELSDAMHRACLNDGRAEQAERFKEMGDRLLKALGDLPAGAGPRRLVFCGL
jgi:hypothetical protein